MRQGRKFRSNWSCLYFLFEKKTVLLSIMYSRSHHQAGTSVIKCPVNTPHLPICEEMLHSKYYLVARVIHVQSLHIEMCVYTYIHTYTYTYLHTYTHNNAYIRILQNRYAGWTKINK